MIYIYIKHMAKICSSLLPLNFPSKRPQRCRQDCYLGIPNAIEASSNGFFCCQFLCLHHFPCEMMRWCCATEKLNTCLDMLVCCDYKLYILYSFARQNEIEILIKCLNYSPSVCVCDYNDSDNPFQSSKSANFTCHNCSTVPKIMECLSSWSSCT